MLEIRRATEEDARSLAPKLRKADVDEIAAVGGYSPLDTLLLSLQVAEVNYAVVAGDEVLAMFGVTRINEIAGAPWVLASDDLMKFRRVFLRWSKKFADAMNADFPVLANLTDARNIAHVRWLRWCGFTFIKQHDDFGPEGRTFYEFARVKG